FPRSIRHCAPGRRAPRPSRECRSTCSQPFRPPRVESGYAPAALPDDPARDDAPCPGWPRVFQPMKADLHCHSTCSDGKLSPSDLVARAETRRVALLALTDHDTTSGLAEAARRAEAAGIKFVPGVEISVTWPGESIHVVGLQIDPAPPPLLEGLAALRARRLERAARIASRLQSLGIPASLEGASAHAAKGDLIGRAHFARYLVASGHARDL